MGEALKAWSESESVDSVKNRKIRYVYNARTYDLWIRGGKLHSRTELSDEWGLTDVLQLKFRLYRRDTDEDHDFEIWTPVSGDLAGVPVRIVDRPRWWLKVELILTQSDLTSAWYGTGSRNCSAVAETSPPSRNQVLD